MLYHSTQKYSIFNRYSLSDSVGNSRHFLGTLLHLADTVHKDVQDSLNELYRIEMYY